MGNNLRQQNTADAYTAASVITETGTETQWTTNCDDDDDDGVESLGGTIAGCIARSHYPFGGLHKDPRHLAAKSKVLKLLARLGLQLDINCRYHTTLAGTIESADSNFRGGPVRICFCKLPDVTI